MTHALELELIAHMLARARMPGGRGPRPARRIAMSSRHQYARQLGNR